jgi:uncharacterized protein with NRDE domain
MCLINFRVGNHPKYKLIIAANRDEEYNRPTEEAHFWKDAPHILAGRDLRGLGTWLGVSTSGRIAALTNIRNKKELLGSYQKTRGKLVSGFLNSTLSPEDYLKNIQKENNEYAGFNILVSDGHHVYYMNNYDSQITLVEEGVHGLSNHRLNTPWPKVERGKKELARLTADDFDTESVFNMLKDNKKAADSDLPKTGLSKEVETQLSPLFIDTEGYGTRCSTVLTVSHDHHVTFSERTYLHQNKTGEVNFDFDIK